LQPKTLATLKEQNDASKTIYVGNLAYGVQQADVYVYFNKGSHQLLSVHLFLISRLFRENLFKDCGGIVYVHPNTDHQGRHKGFVHVEFSTAEAAQKVSFYDHVLQII